jgi:hypothetical protein
MSGFQRFVTYINLYEENNKIRNVGFAKIEKRSGQCRMEVHMRGTGYTNISCPTYLFVRKENRLLGISLGKIQMQSGNGDLRITLDGDNICQSGYSLEQAGGLLIFVTDKVMFASQWDDTEIQRGQFRILELKPEPPVTDKPLAKQEKIPEVKKKEKVNERSEIKPTKINDQKLMSKKVQKEALEQKQQVELKEAVVKKEAPILKVPPVWNDNNFKETVEEKCAEVDLTSNSVCEQANHEKDSSKDYNVGVAAAEIERSIEPLTFDKSKPPKESIQAAEAAPILEPESEPMINEKQQDSPWVQKWKFIVENYPVLTPFEAETDIQCVRIELKDLRLLPKRYWYLGNNSFLLHGFFNYRYLILGAIYSEETTRWFIGVPGVFQSQEKVMASIFGFPEYKSEKKTEHKTDQFGYWYRFMDE